MMRIFLAALALVVAFAVGASAAGKGSEKESEKGSERVPKRGAQPPRLAPIMFPKLPEKLPPVAIISPLPPTKPNPAIAALRGFQAIVRTNVGEMTIDVNPDAAPNTVHNFLKLAQRGYYDSLRFSCIFPDTMILCGDPKGTGKDDIGYTIPYESSPLAHVAGTIAMDRMPPGPSSGSRFFINLKAQHHLERDYTAFGRITKGIEVAKRIAGVAVSPNEGRPVPVEDVVIEEILIAKKKEVSPPTEGEEFTLPLLEEMKEAVDVKEPRGPREPPRAKPVEEEQEE